MELNITVKIKLLPNEAQAKLFKDTCKEYTKECNLLSNYLFKKNSNDLPTAFELQDELYHEIKTKTTLKSGMILSCFRTVIGSYRTVRAQLSKKYYSYQDDNGKWIRHNKTLLDLWYPIEYKKEFCDLKARQDYSFDLKRSKLSINTIGAKRVKVAYCKPKYFDKYFDKTWKFGTSKLIYKKGKWYMLFSITKEIDTIEDKSEYQHVVGIDRGLRFLATCYDEKGNTLFFD